MTSSFLLKRPEISKIGMNGVPEIEINDVMRTPIDKVQSDLVLSDIIYSIPHYSFSIGVLYHMAAVTVI